MVNTRAVGSAWLLLMDSDGRGMSLSFWGTGAGVALIYIGSKIPVMRDDVLKKIPLVRGYFIEQDNIPDSDKPF
jgi:hypothetical protein